MTKSYFKFSLERLAYVVHGEAADGTAGDGVVRGVEHAENPVSNLGSKCAINIHHDKLRKQRFSLLSFEL